MNKVVGVLVIGLGIILIVVGIQGSQTKILNDIKAVNPRIRKLTGTQQAQAQGRKPQPKSGGSNPGGGGQFT